MSMPNTEITETSGKKVTENIYLCPDGKYRWTYEFKMLKNPSILIMVCKVLVIIFAALMVLMILSQLFSRVPLDPEDYLHFYGGMLILLGVVLGLTVIVYLIVAAVYGWSYIVLFTMDEDGVELRMMKKDFDKARALGWLTAMAGLAAGRFSVAGAGILAASRSTSTSIFYYVRKVKAVRRREVIYVNQLLGHNQVYAKEADFGFVRDFIVQHCPNAKIIG